VLAFLAVVAGVADASSCGSFGMKSTVVDATTFGMTWVTTANSSHEVVKIVVTPTAARGVAAQTYVLTKCTDSADKNEIAAEYPGAAVISVPVNGLSAVDTVQIALLETLGVYTKLRAFPSPLLISSDVVRTWIQDPVNSVESYPGAGFGTDYAAHSAVTGVDVLMSSVYQYGPFGAINDYNASGVLDKMVLINELDESTPLGRAEWIKVVGLLTGKESNADSLYSTTKANYETAKKFAAAAVSQPKVWYNGFYTNIWSSPVSTEWYPAKSGQYTYQYLADAYTEYVLPSSEVFSSNGGLSWARGVALANKAEFWLSNSQSWASLSAAAAVVSADSTVDFKTLANVPSFQCENVWDNDLSAVLYSGSIYPRNDFFESAVMHPDQVLKEIIMIVHPELSSIGTHKYFRKVPRGTLSADNCPFDASEDTSDDSDASDSGSSSSSSTSSTSTAAKTSKSAATMTGLNLGLTVSVAILGSALIAIALGTLIVLKCRARLSRKAVHPDIIA